MIVLILTIMALIYSPIRPGEPPVPFPYDPNRVNYEIIQAVRLYPNKNLSFVRKIIEPDGQQITLACSDPSVAIGSPVISIDPDDPDGISLIYEYSCLFPVNRPPGVYYLDFTATDNDPNESMSDSRTMLIYVWPKNRPPVISQ